MAKNDIEAKDKLLLSCKEAAAMLNTSEPTLRKMLDVGLIRHMEIRGVVKIYIFELHEFCKQMSGKSVDPYADDVVKVL